jgi:hypothetical protein
MQMPGAPAGQVVKTDMPIVNVVQDVQRGVASVKVTVGPISMNGQSMGQPAQTQDLKIDARGQIVGGAQGATSGFQTQLPEKPITVGGTWTATMPMAGMGSNQTVKTIYKFLGMRTVDGKRMADLEVTVSGTGQMAMSGKGRALMLASDGSLYRNTLDMKATIPAAQGAKPQTMALNVLMTRR